MDLRSVLMTGVAAVAIAGCGGGGGGYPSSPAMGGNGGQTTGLSASVGVREYLFTPGAVSIKVGQSVTWTNGGTVTHTVTADDGSFYSAGLAPATPDTSAYGGGTGGGVAGSYTRTFTSAGTFAYHCSIHPSMTGTVTVTP